jgi:probable HAF family extracellular repeat protein
LQSFPTDVNNPGVVVGSSVNAQEEEHAFAWRDGVMRDLGTLGGPGSRANAINDRGVAVGFAEVADQVSHPARWDGSTVEDLTAHGFAAHDEAADIDDHGRIAGTRDNRATLFR